VGAVVEEGRGLDPQWRTTRSLSKRCRSPDRLTFRIGGVGEVSIPTPSKARTVFKTGSVAGPITPPWTSRQESNLRSTRVRSAELFL
jgi:hypothetical protein